MQLIEKEMEPSYTNEMQLIKRNTHQMEHSSKMEMQLIKRNTHQKEMKPSSVNVYLTFLLACRTPKGKSLD